MLKDRLNSTGARRRLITFLVLLLFVSFITLLGQVPDTKKPLAKKMEEIKGDHYIIRTTASINDAKKVLNYMEAMYPIYTSWLSTKHAPPRFTVILYKDRQEYIEAGFPSNSAACYRTRGGEWGQLNGYVSSDEEYMYSTFAHEGTHQVHHMYFVIPYTEGQVPIWFDEGMAECLGGNSGRRDGKVFCCLKDGRTVQGRLRTIQDAIKHNAYYPLKELFALSQDAFYQNGELCYAPAWSFCHFLATYPLKEDKKRVVPAGDYSHIIRRLYEALKEYTVYDAGRDKRSRFHSYEDIYNYAFQTKDKKPIDLDELEKQWKDYVLNFEEPDEEGKKQELAAQEIWGKIMQAYQTSKWDDLPPLIAELKNKYKTTKVFKGAEFDINQLPEIVKWKKEGKTEPYETLLFSEKSSELQNWAIQDNVTSSLKTWRVEKGILIGESPDSYMTFKQETKLDWTFTVQFKIDKVLSEKTTSEFNVGFLVDRVLEIIPLKELKEDWNEVVIDRINDQLKYYLNNKSLGAIKLKTDTSGNWGFHIQNAKVLIKSVSLKLK